MSDDPYNVCFLTNELPEDVGEQIRHTARTCGFVPQETGGEDEISLEFDELTTVRVFLNRGESWNWNDPRIVISFWTMPMQTDVDVQAEDHSRTEVQNRVEHILDLIKGIVSITDPIYVWSMLAVGPQPDEGLRPEERPIADSISRTSWITVFSSRIVEQMGGREHLLSSPAWKIEELDSGHILILNSDNPTDPTEDCTASTHDHLFG